MSEGTREAVMVDRVSIGICQNYLNYDFEDNIARASIMVDRAASMGADMAVFTEMFFTPYEPEAIRSAAQYSMNALEVMKERALRNKIHIIAGSMPWTAEGRRFFNRAYVIGPGGGIIHHHDKIHLFDCTPPGGPSVKESDVIAPGGSLKHFGTPWGNASVIVCYDIRFTPLAQLLAERDVRLLFVPAAFSISTGKAHWEMLVRMRALELQAFVIGVQPAYNPDLRYIPWGHSLAASPWGEVLFDAGSEEGVHIVKLDLAQIDKIRAQFPLLSHRRHDLYQTIWKGGS